MPAPTPIPACVISAMPEEMAPMLKLLESCGHYSLETMQTPIGSVTEVRETCHESTQETSLVTLVLAVTGIGFSATASALGWLFAQYAPAALFSIGSAGGVGEYAQVKDVVLGISYRNSGADGTAFGYVRGQVPGQPEYFSADPALLAAGAVAALETDEICILSADMISSDAFVTDANIGDIREAFPSAVTADMESYAAAHTAHQWGIPFLSVRGISDLCSRPEDQAVAFHAELSEVAELSARTALLVVRAAHLI